MLQGNDPPFPSEQHSWAGVLPWVLSGTWEWVFDLTSAVLLWERKLESRSGKHVVNMQ